jgi:hypothetical protein
MWWTKHFLLSILIGMFYFLFTNSIAGSFLVFASNIFIDIDHYIFYFIFQRKSFFKTYKIYQKINKKEISDVYEKKYILLFHNFEFVSLIIILSIFYPPLIPITIGILFHFVIDVLYIRKFKIKHYYSAVYYVISKLI